MFCSCLLLQIGRLGDRTQIVIGSLVAVRMIFLVLESWTRESRMFAMLSKMRDSRQCYGMSEGDESMLFSKVIAFKI